MRDQISLEGTQTEKMSNYTMSQSQKQPCCSLLQTLTSGTADTGPWILESPQLLSETKGLCYQSLQEMDFMLLYSPTLF